MAKNQKVTLHIKLSDGSVKDVSLIVPAGGIGAAGRELHPGGYP